MEAAKPNELVQLIERKFEDPEDAVTAIEAGLATEAQLQDWALPEDRPQQDRAENDEKALQTLQDALSPPSLKDKVPALWAQIQRNIGRLFRQRLQGDQGSTKRAGDGDQGHAHIRGNAPHRGQPIGL